MRIIKFWIGVAVATILVAAAAIGAAYVLVPHGAPAVHNHGPSPAALAAWTPFDSYGWPAQGVKEIGPDCLAAASVTFLEVYGLHVPQVRFAQQDQGANVGHAAVLLNGYLRHRVHVVTMGGLTATQLGTLLAFRHGPILATLWSAYLPNWRGQPNGAHEVMLWRLTGSGGVLFWDPYFGWSVTTIYDIAAASWEYIVPSGRA